MTSSRDPKMIRHLLVVCFLFILALFIGAAIFHSIENYSYLDSFYFTTSTTTTVGYGDIFPRTEGGKIFTIFYSTFGVVLFFYMVTLFAVVGADMDSVIPRITTRTS